MTHSFPSGRASDLLGREEGVGGIFDEFGRATAGKEQGRLVEVERPVDFPHELGGTLVVRAHDNAVRPLEILDCRAFAQELRVGYDPGRSDEHTSELQSLMRHSYAVLCSTKK